MVDLIEVDAVGRGPYLEIDGNNEARERSEPFFSWFPRKKKSLHNGSYEHRLPKTKSKTLFCTECVCVIQYRN